MEMADKQKNKQLDDLLTLSSTIKGSLLEMAIWMEKIIEDIITIHFCQDEKRRTQFYSLIMNEIHIPFLKKIITLKKLLKIYYPEIYKKYPTLVEDLQNVRNLRNNLVHSTLDNSDEFLAKNYNDRIRLVYFKDGKIKPLIITIEKWKIIKYNWALINDDLIKIFEEISSKS